MRDDSTKRFKWRINLSALRNALPSIRNFVDDSYVDDASLRYGGPTLFIGGTKSRYITEDKHQRIRHFFPQAQIKMIEDADHWVHFEKPDEFADTVDRFLKEHHHHY